MQIKLYTGKCQVILIILILSPYLFLKNVIFRHFSRISCTNLSTKFVRIRMNFLHEKLVMLRKACTVSYSHSTNYERFMANISLIRKTSILNEIPSSELSFFGLYPKMLTQNFSAYTLYIGD